MHWKSRLGRCVNPLATKRALNLSTEPSGWYLTRKSHLQSTTFFEGSHGTNSHVRFRTNASNSFFIASRQCGTCWAFFLKVLGREEVVWTTVWNCLGLRLLVLDRVIMLWAGGDVELGATREGCGANGDGTGDKKEGCTTGFWVKGLVDLFWSW